MCLSAAVCHRARRMLRIQPICVGKCGTGCVDIAKDSGNETALAKKSANTTIRLISLNVLRGSFKAPPYPAPLKSIKAKSHSPSQYQ